LTPTNADFDTVNTGSSSSAKTFTLANAGNGALTIASVGISGTNAASFTIGSNSCGSTLAAGASCTIAVTFTPTAAGAASATLSVYDAVGTQSASLTGTGAAARATLTPASADFGSVNTGSLSAKTFTLANAGNAALTITSVSIAGTNAASFTIGSNSCGSTLAAGASCTVTVTFAPTTTGTASAVLTVTDVVGAQNAALTGMGTTPTVPQAALSPTSASFGNVNVGSTGSVQTFTVANAGNAALTISSVSVSGTNSSMFMIGSNTCGSSLSAGGTCSIGVSFKPTAVGTVSATLSVVDSVGTQSASLSGIGIAVVAADFGIAATPSQQATERGTSVSYTIQLTSSASSNPFTGTTTLSASGLPSGATVTFSPSSLVPGASQANSSTMTVTVPALSARLRPSPVWTFGIVPTASLGGVMLLWPFRRRRRAFHLLLLFVASFVCVGLTACGGGTGFSAPGSTSTIFVTATSGSTTHTTTVTLKVN